jgi:uncharacterized protein YicC (UPF0701 family)
MQDVHAVLAALGNLNRTTEADFLAVGSKLISFLSAARQLHADLAGLTALVSGEQAQQACDALLAVRGYALEMQRRAEDGGRALLELQRGANLIRQSFGTFEKIAASFRVTATLARIEAARLSTSQQNLKNLADDVRSCSESIKSRANQVLEAALSFHARIASALREFSRSDGLRQKELPALLAAVDADLDLFKTRQREAAGVSWKLSSDLNSVTADLANIATSIQFHDITRQQMEHVMEALEGLLPDASLQSISSSGGALVRLQNAQLKSAAAAFANSTEKIDRDLQGIGGRVGAMAAASNRIQGPDRKGSASLLDGMQSRFSAVARAVTDLHSLECGARATVADLENASQDMRVAVKEVQSIESQLSLLFVNGVVSATRIGAQGQVLIAIAAAIRELKTESALRSGGAETALHAIAGAIRSLAGGADSEAYEASGASLLENLNARVAELQSAMEAGAHAAANVAAQADNLCANVEEARGHLGIGRVFSETTSHCCGLLDGVSAQAQPQEFSGQPAVGQAAERYTMQAERDVHQAATHGLVSPPAGGASSSAPVENTDEVEFF